MVFLPVPKAPAPIIQKPRFETIKCPCVCVSVCLSVTEIRPKTRMVNAPVEVLVTIRVISKLDFKGPKKNCNIATAELIWVDP